VTIADALSSSVKVVSRAGMAAAKKPWRATDWCSTQHQLVGAKPDGRPHLEGALQIPDKLLTSCVSHLHPTRHAYTSTHLPVPLLSLG